MRLLDDGFSWKRQSATSRTVDTRTLILHENDLRNTTTTSTTVTTVTSNGWGDASHRKSVIQLPGVYLPDEVSEGGGQEKHVGLKPSDCALQPCRLHMIATEENQATSRTCLKVPHMILPQMFNSRHRHDFTVNWSYPFHISLTDTAETVGHQIEKQIWVGKRKKGKNCDSLKSKIATYTNSNK